MSDELRRQTKAAYDTVAVRYAEVLPDTSFEAELDLAMIRHFIAELGDAAPARILDAGCGAGRMITHLRSMNGSHDVSGVDLSSAMVRLARSAHPDLVITEGDLAALPFDDEQFDGVLAWYSIIHMPPQELASVFGEFRRVLRPGGSLLLAYQAGTGERTLSRPYGHDIELRAFLHHTPDVASALIDAGLVMRTRLDREARTSERHAQGFVIAVRPERDPVDSRRSRPSSFSSIPRPESGRQ